MKVLYICAVLFPLLAYAKPSLKLELLSRLLQALDKRDNGNARYETRYLPSNADTTAARQGSTTPTQDPTTPSQGPTEARRDPTTSTADDTGLTTDSHLTSSSKVVVTPLPMSPAPKDNPTLPPLRKDDLPLTPEEYIRHVTQGMCVMLAYVRGKEKGGKVSDKDNHRKSDKKTDRDAFPWIKAEKSLQQLCDLVETYNSEPMKLAEAFVKQMAEHKGDNKGLSRSRSRATFV